MSDHLNERMRADWNARAREDARYYVAFGQRGQDEAGFLATANEMATSFRNELPRLAVSHPRARRALEIGCGPGRLMLPLASHFGEIHGVDISEEMIRLARETLRDVPHAHPHHAPASDLAAFADDSFDYVYSYAVFQHIPSRETVFGYFQETRRVLKQDGIARFQLNGLPETAPHYDTWAGVRISAAEVADFARENDFQLLALEGIATQYMWTTWRKRPDGWASAVAGDAPQASASIRRITNTHSSEPLAPTRGRYASISLWMEGLPPDCDLNSLKALIGGAEGYFSYIGPLLVNGLQQVNIYLPEGLSTGLEPVELLWLGRSLCPPATLRLVPHGPPVPRIVSVTDGVNLLSGNRIVSGIVKATLEEIERPDQLEIRLGGRVPEGVETFCTDPRVPKYEINFPVPAQVGPGAQRLDVKLGRRAFPPVYLEVVREA